MDNSILTVNVILIETDSKVANGLDETLHVLELGTMIRRRRAILDRTATARRLPSKIKSKFYI
jgi:hypothetical protein